MNQVLILEVGSTKIGVVRNPYERAVFHYMHGLNWIGFDNWIQENNLVGQVQSYKKCTELIAFDDWENELKRRSENSKASRRHTARETRRPALTAAGKAFLHEIALDRVKTRYTSGPKSSSKTLRMRMLSDIGV